MVKSFSKQRVDQLQTPCCLRCSLDLFFELYFLVILALSLDFSSIITVAAGPQAPPSKATTPPECAGLRERQEEDGNQERGMTIPNTSVTDVTRPLSPPSLTPPPSPAAAQSCKVEAELVKQRVEERAEKEVEEKKTVVNEEPRKKPFWLDDDDDLPPMM